MRIIFTLVCLFTSFNSYGQDQPRYSFSEFFAMIEAETDTVFTLENAVIYTDLEADSSFLVHPDSLRPLYSFDRTKPVKPRIKVNKHIRLTNIYFEDVLSDWSKMEQAMFAYIHFQKPLVLRNVHALKMVGCTFDDDLKYSLTENYSPEFKSVFFVNNTFYEGFFLGLWPSNKFEYYTEFQFGFAGNRLNQSSTMSTVMFNLYTAEIQSVSILNNTVGEKGFFALNLFESPKDVQFDNNKINCLSTVDLKLGDLPPLSFSFRKNSFTNSVGFDVSNLHLNTRIDWEQFEGKVFSKIGYLNYLGNEPLEIRMYQQNRDSEWQDSMYQIYFSRKCFQLKDCYKDEMSLFGTFYNYYSENFDKEDANRVYIVLKDLETERLGYQYSINPTFNGYFKWKMNQFLKVFSDYGTNPTKSIIFSVYVILIFGGIYLFFPNSWDYHGKYRIVHRYGFLMQYMTRTAGIQDIYLERRQRDFEEHQKFEAVITESQNKVPRFFTYSAKLLNKWAKADSVIVAFLLKRVDVLKGKWAELSKGKKRWKAVLLTIMLIIGIIYDIFIKILNALMLSINTFTTLGFGEIPIKGLPRYLAIVQGFIGWFLLTIFSVSLISQLME